MGKLNLFKTAVVQQAGIDNQVDSIAKFLISNRHLIRIDTESTAEIFKTSVLSKTPISTAFETMMSSRKQDIFVALNIPPQVSTPEAITVDHLTFDVLQLQDFSASSRKAINALPEFADKIIVNLTPLLRKKSQTSVTDMNRLQSIIVRGLLVRSYYLSRNWLTPALIKYLSETYSMIISTNIARDYNLDYNDQLVVATALAAYFHQKCYADVKPGEFPVTVNDCGWLGTRVEIVDRLEFFKDILQNQMGTDLELDINKLCTLVSKCGPERLESFSTKALYTRNASMGSDHLSAMMSLEYPPYWAHQVLLALSGVRSGLQIAIKRGRGKLERDGKQFAETLVRSSAFIPEL